MESSTSDWQLALQERQRLGKTRAEVVKAVRVHSAELLRSVEHQNPRPAAGVVSALRELGDVGSRSLGGRLRWRPTPGRIPTATSGLAQACSLRSSGSAAALHL